MRKGLADTRGVGNILRPPIGGIRIQRSSVVERSAVNRLVVGSNPTAGANNLLLPAKGDYVLIVGVLLLPLNVLALSHRKQPDNSLRHAAQVYDRGRFGGKSDSSDCQRSNCGRIQRCHASHENKHRRVREPRRDLVHRLSWSVAKVRDRLRTGEVPHLLFQPRRNRANGVSKPPPPMVPFAVRSSCSWSHPSCARL